MRCFFTVLKMDLRNLFRNPVLIGYNTVFALLLILIMGFLTSGDYASGKDAFQYYLVTMLIYGMLSGAMTATNCFMERDIRRPNLRIIFSPAGSFSVYFSKTLASFLFDYTMHLLLLALLCPLLHVTLGAQPLYFLLLMAPVEFTAASLGTFFCCLLHTEEAASTLLSMTISLLCILGGTFFSLNGMGRILSMLSSFSPVKWLNDAFFALCCDNSQALAVPVAFGCLIFSLLLTAGCALFFKTEDYL